MALTRTEIFAQYDAIKRTIALLDEKADSLKKTFGFIDAKKIVFTGCGSSFSLSCSFRTIASLRTQLPVYAVASGDLWLHVGTYKNIVKDALVISVSRSGQTSEVLNAYKAVREMNLNTHFWSIICAEDTPLEALSDLTLQMPWAFDNSVCQTRCVSNIYTAGALLIDTLMGDGSIRASFEAVVQNGDAYLQQAEALAKEIVKLDWDHAVVLADGEIDGLAEEGALAYKEISQQNSNYYHLLDVRHGPMVLFNRKTLVVACVKSPAIDHEMKLVEDCVRTGAITVCSSDLPVEHKGAKSIAFGSKLHPVAAGLGLVALCQLISYNKSLVVGCDPDAPDGLTAWIKL